MRIKGRYQGRGNCGLCYPVFGGIIDDDGK